jgi:hypothetical protein
MSHKGDAAIKTGLFLLGLLAWVAVAAIAILMAEIDEPVLGYFPIVAAVLIAWGAGEVVSRRMAEESR